MGGAYSVRVVKTVNIVFLCFQKQTQHETVTSRGQLTRLITSELWDFLCDSVEQVARMAAQ